MNARSDTAPLRLYLQAARQIERSIQDGLYPVGGKLPSEGKLAEKLGVSRPTIREAIIALESRGLVQTRHGAGVFVTSVTTSAPLEGLESELGPFEVTEARMLFEGEAVALAATTITPAEIEELEVYLARMDDKSLDQTARERADRAFHVTLAKATRNEAVRNVIETLWDMRYRSPLCIYLFSLARDIGIQPPAGEHRLILDALRARDADGARRAMRAHIARITQSLFVATEHDERERSRLKVDAQRHDFARRASLVDEQP